MSAVDEHIALVRRAILAVNEGVLLPGFVTEDCIRHDLTGNFPDFFGPEGIGGFVRLIRTAIPDFHVEIEDIFGSDDRVVARLVFTGTHSGELLGAPPSGKRLSFNAINLYRFRSGQVAETWQLQDLWGLFAQIGLFPLTSRRQAG